MGRVLGDWPTPTSFPIPRLCCLHEEPWATEKGTQEFREIIARNPYTLTPLSREEVPTLTGLFALRFRHVN